MSSAAVGSGPATWGGSGVRTRPVGTVRVLPVEGRAGSPAPDAFPASPLISPHTFFARGTREAGRRCFQTLEKRENKATSWGEPGIVDVWAGCWHRTLSKDTTDK